LTALIGRLKYLLATAGVVIAAAATFFGNIDKISSGMATWLGPWLRQQTTIELVIDSSVRQPLIVAIADGPKLIDTQTIAPGGTANFIVAANAKYAMVWNGANTKTETAGEILAPKTTTRWRLTVKAKEADNDVLALRLDGAAQDQQKSATSATVLASVAAAQSAQNPAARPPTSNLLPEFDRAILFTGLLETGTTDCHRKAHAFLFLTVGCLGFSVPGFLTDILKQIDQDDISALAHIFGPDEALVRDLLSSDSKAAMKKINDLRAEEGRARRLGDSLGRLSALPTFRYQYQTKALQTYGEAIQLASALDLRSERGVLMVFDNIIFLGRAAVNRQVARMKEMPPPAEPLTETAKLARYAESLKSSVGGRPAVANFAARRINLITSGRATFKGIVYDLNELGIRDDAPQTQSVNQ
jgi:hypothetical protein